MSPRYLLGFRPCLLVVAIAAGTAGNLTGQDIPQLPPGVTPEQARQMLAQRPDLALRVRQWIRESGLPPGEIRQRLRERGYPADLLDAYMVADSLAQETDTIPGAYPRPTDNQFRALATIGVADPNRQDSLLFAGDSIALRLYQDSLRIALAASDSARLALRGLKLFGFETLRQPTVQFQPIVTGPVDDSYVLGPGDELVLLLSGAVELVRTFEVSSDGLVVLPDVGTLSANGLTLAQFRRVLGERLARVYSGASAAPGARTRFDVTVTRVRVQQVRVVGEVAQPGTYMVAATGGVLTALYNAGGLTENGNFRAVTVHRGDQLMATVDLYDYLAGGRVPGGVPLAPGDVVFVGVAGPRVAVAGEVRRPAIYEIRPGESLRDVLQLAGGLTALGNAERATIARVIPLAQRTEPGVHRTVVTADLRAVLGATAAPVTMYDGDSVTVFRLTGGRRHAVAVSGAVWQPGVYELETGMRLWDAIQAAGGVRPETYRGRVQIIRTYADSTRQLFGTALGADDQPPAQNPPLAERDSILVYAVTDFRPARWVHVHGAVQRPDSIPFADSMTVRDAILMAGGVTDDASLLEAEVTRMRLATGGDSIARVLRVPLDSSYVFDVTSHLARPVGRAGAEPILEPWDQVLVLRNPGVELPRRVTVTGSVQSPGTFTLLTREERLSSVLARAGGLRPDAHPDGIALYRRTANTARRVPASLATVLRSPGGREDLVLVAGDSLHIPAYSATVRVEGGVNAPSVVAWRSGASWKSYVDAAGGFSQSADKKNPYVVQANGHIERKGKPGPGATVVVPEKDPGLTQPSNAAAIWTAITQVVASVTTVLVLILTRN